MTNRYSEKILLLPSKEPIYSACVSKWYTSLKPQPPLGYMPISGTRALDFDGSSGTEDNALSPFKVGQKTPVVTVNLSRLTYLQIAITKYGQNIKTEVSESM